MNIRTDNSKQFHKYAPLSCVPRTIKVFNKLQVNWIELGTIINIITT